MKAPGHSFFLSARRKPLHRSTVNLLLHKYGEKAQLPVAVHPHMLRHACGFALVDKGAGTRLI
jgi:type 1 fimbriae regulatory protein FimB